MKNKKINQSEIEVHQKVNLPFGNDSEAVETDKTGSGYKKNHLFRSKMLWESEEPFLDFRFSVHKKKIASLEAILKA